MKVIMQNLSSSYITYNLEIWESLIYSIDYKISRTRIAKAGFHLRRSRNQKRRAIQL